MDKKLTCVCGKEYWPNQAWLHNACMVVNKADTVVVNRRAKDRHRKTPERAAYQLEWMRKRRAAVHNG